MPGESLRCRDVRRLAVVVAALAIVLAIGLFFALRGGGGDKTVAHVDGEPVQKSQLEAVIQHFRLQAKAEDRPFPAEASDAGRRVRDRLLALLVYRVELREAARRLGITVTRVQVLRRLQAAGSGGGEQETRTDSFGYGSAETQLLTEAIFRKVTRGVKA